MHGAYELVGSAAAMFEQDEKYIPHSHGHSILPDHLQLSYDNLRNPWQNLFMQDFILVAEFSEHEGPRPLFTIPEEAGEMFDKNAFAVHVMSVDYQMQTSYFFSLVDDTQLIFSEDRENIYAYVHHFILYDIEARGFVRPFCMCYISNSKKKILCNLEHFIQEFGEISKHFKTVNKPLFHNDLLQRLADLTYMKDCLQKFESEHSEWIEFPKNASKNFHGLNNETIDSMLVETNKAIDVLETTRLLMGHVKRTQDNKVEADDFIEPTDCTAATQNGDTEPPADETFTNEDVSNCCQSNEEHNHDQIIQRLLRERRRHLLTLRDIHALCNYNAVEGLAYLQKLHQRFYQPFEVFSLIKEETPLLDSFSSAFTIGGSFVMNFQNNITVSLTEPLPCVTRTIADPIAANSYDSAHSAQSTESFKSCVDESEPDQEICRNGSDLVIYRSFRTVTSEDLLGGDDFASSAVELTETTTLTNYTGGSSVHSRQSLDDDDDNEITSKTQSPTATAQLDPPPGLTRPRLYRRSTSDLPSLTHKPSQPFRRQLSAVETQSNFSKALPRNVPVATTRSDIIRTDVHSWVDIENFPLGSTPQYTAIYGDMCQNGEVNRNREFVDDGLERMYVQCYAQQLCRRKADGPGGGILRVFRDYGYLVHLLYALLSGRTVVILAEPSHQRNVHSLITSLWLFVPGHFRRSQQVVLWRTKPFRLKDLGRFKLVGLSKSKQFYVLPNSVEVHVTTLDFESGCLKTPPYQGEFLNEMLASRRCWKSDSIFLAYIHSIFLEMSLKAFVCYYATSLRTSTEDTNLAWKNRLLVPRDFSIEYMTDILDALGILGCDANIILYFLDLLAQQQLTDCSSRSQTSDNISFDSFSSTTSYDHSGPCNHATKTRPITLDFTQRMVYRKSSE